MNKIKKVLSAAIIVLVVIITASSIFISLKGKDIVRELMEKSLNRKVDVSSLKLKLPFSIEVNNLAIENLIKAKQIIITPSIIGFLSGHPALNNLQFINPEFFIVRNEDGSFNLPAASGGKSNFALAGIVIDNGTVSFIDKKIDPAGFVSKIQDIYLKMHTSLLSMRPLNISFNLSSKIIPADNSQPAELKAGGWVDLLRKNMKGKVELSNLDAVQFLPYYSHFMSTPLEKGRIFFTSDLNAKNNDLTADCRLNVRDVVFKQKEGKEKDFSISVLDIFTGGKGENGQNQDINLDFIIKTKLDKPRVDWAKITGSVVAKSLTDQMINNPEETINKVKDIGKQFEALGKSFLKKKAGDVLGVPENQGAPVNQETQQNIQVQPVQ